MCVCVYIYIYIYIYIISRLIFLRMRNVANKSCRGDKNTRVMFKIFFSFENLAVYEVMWINLVQPDKPKIIIQCVPLATEPDAEDIATKFEQESVRCLRNEEECVCSVASGTPYIILRRYDVICVSDNQIKNRHTHLLRSVLIAFLLQQWLPKAHQCYVIRTLSVLFINEKERVYRAVRAASSYKFVFILVFKGQ